MEKKRGIEVEKFGRRGEQIQEIQKTLRRLGVTPRKSRGQNFLLSESFLYEILALSQVEKGASVLEIGPGLGAFTEVLVGHSVALSLVELEPLFYQYLVDERKLVASNRAHCGDVREVTLSQPGPMPERVWRIVGNLPYSLSSEILCWFLDERAHVLSGTFLLQKEVVERLTAPIGSRESGVLTVAAQLLCDVTAGDCIDGTEFFPEPEVMSQLLHLEPLSEPRVRCADVGCFMRVVKAGFSARRKVLRSALHQGMPFLDRERIQESCKELGIKDDIRAENLSLEDWGELARSLAPHLQRGQAADEATFKFCKTDREHSLSKSGEFLPLNAGLPVSES